MITFTTIQCTDCGGKLTINRSNGTGVCKHCGREYFIEQNNLLLKDQKELATTKKSISINPKTTLSKKKKILIWIIISSFILITILTPTCIAISEHNKVENLGSVPVVVTKTKTEYVNNTVEVPVIKEVPVITEVIKEVPVITEVVKEVPVITEVVKEVEKEVLVEVNKTIEVPTDYCAICGESIDNCICNKVNNNCYNIGTKYTFLAIGDSGSGMNNWSRWILYGKQNQNLILTSGHLPKLFNQKNYTYTGLLVITGTISNIIKIKSGAKYQYYVDFADDITIRVTETVEL